MSNVAALRRITPFPASASLSRSSCALKASEKGENKRAQMPAKSSIVVVIEVGSSEFSVWDVSERAKSHDEFSVQLPTFKRQMSSHALLLRLFLSSSFFSIHVALKYLLLYSDNIGITYYLTRRLKELQIHELCDVWGFIWYIVLAITYLSTCISIQVPSAIFS